MSESGPNPLRSAAKIVSVNVVLLLIGLVGLELLFGNWFQPNRMSRLNLIRDAWLQYKVGSLYPTESQTITYVRDRHGLRGERSADGHVDILTIGGSATDQRYITEGQTWQDVLRSEFLKNGTDLSIVNAGVDGQSTVGHIRNFEWWFPFVPNLKVRYFLFYIGVNDFFVQGKYDDVVKLTSWEVRLKERSALYSLVRKIQGLYQAEVVSNMGHGAVDFSKAKWTDQPRYRDHVALIKPTLIEYEKRVGHLLDQANAWPGVPICVTQPARYYKKVGNDLWGLDQDIVFEKGAVNGVDYYHMIRLLHAATLRICREKGGIPIDLANEGSWEDSDFYDTVHNTPRGAAKIGHILYGKLNGLAAEPPPGRRVPPPDLHTIAPTTPARSVRQQ